MGFQSKIVPEEILKIEDLTVRFGGFTAINNLNMTLERGELRVLIGPNGAGKSTLLDVITGKVRPNAGRVTFHPVDRAAVDVGRTPAEKIARLGIGRSLRFF